MKKDAKSIKIAIDARPLSSSHTGVAFYIKSIIRALLKEGFSIILVSDRKIVSNIVLKKCQQTILPSSSRFWWEQFKLLKFLNRTKPDIYFASWNYGIPWLYRGRTKFILSVLDVIPAQLPQIYLKKISDKLKYFISLKVAIKKAQKIITISKASARNFKKLFPRYKITPILINLNLKTPLPAANKYGDYFVYLGGVDPRKNIDKLIKAYAKFVKTYGLDIKLMLVGRDFDSFNNLIEGLGIRKRIIITGYIDDKKKMTILHHAKALLYLSSLEGFGLPVAEAIICGTPIIAGDNAAVREIANRAAIFVNPKNTDTIVLAMKLVLREKTRAKFKKAAQNQLKIINNQENDQKIIKIFEDLIQW